MTPSLRARLLGFFFATTALVACSTLSSRPSEEKAPAAVTLQTLNLKYPVTEAEPIEDVIFGQPVRDPYRWLEDVRSKDVQNWMKSQDDVTRWFLARLPGRTKLEARLKELLYIDSISPPQKRGGRLFYERRHADRDKKIIYWRESENAAERALLDPNTMEPKGRVSIGVWSVSEDGKYVAYTVKLNNADESTMHVREVVTGKTLAADRIPGTNYTNASWTKDSQGFYYAKMPTDPKIPANQRVGLMEIRYHKIGTTPSKDPLVYPATNNPERFLNAEVSSDGKFLFVNVSHGWSATDLFVRDLSSKDGKFVPMMIGEKAQAFADSWNGHHYIFTTLNAPKGRVVRAPIAQPTAEHWKTIVPEQNDAVLDSFNLFGGRLAVTLLKDASSRLTVHELDGTLVRELDLGGIGTARWASGRGEDDDAFFTFTSYTVPSEVRRVSMKALRPSLWAKIDVKIDPSPYTVTQEFFVSKDGTRVPMFIIHRKDIKKNASTPMILYGYGGFNSALTPGFSASLYPWLEAGGAYSVVNLRGGGEYGEAWHRAGMLENKQNVFDDFIGAAEHLIKTKYTASQRLAIRGGSNGGLLVGAALTQRPDLFRAALCAVPLLDMIRYHKVGIGSAWIPEYGHPEAEKDFKNLLGYSPYHRAKAGIAYPATLFLAADSDDRVDPMHARKMAALLQTSNKGPAPILLRIQRNAGHGGADLVKEAVVEATDVYSFLFNELGMKAEPFRD